MLIQIHNAIRKCKLFSPGQHVVVAVSGGADSVALLCALRDLSRTLGIRLTVAHLNHRIRGRAADRDATFVRRLARRWKVPVIVGRIDVPRLARQEGFSLEMAARKARYDFLADTARRVKAHVIATAHTADDQAETVLLKLIRGAGPKGLAGIPFETTLRKTRIVRPLLEVPRDAIVAFLRARGESWCEDKTNHDESFQRNKVRHRILPLLESELNPQIRTALRRTADILREEDRWLDSLAVPLLASCLSGTQNLSIVSLKRQPLAARRRIVRLWLVAAGIPAECIDFDAANRIEHLVAGSKTSATVRVAGPWTVERCYDALEVRSRKPAAHQAFRQAIRIPGRTRVTTAGLLVTTSLAPGLVKDRRARLGAYPAHASLNWTTAEHRKVFLRSWRPGDRMKPFGMKGSKKIQDIFVDEKVPAEQRRGLPLFECGGEIIWLPGHRVARGWEVHDPSARALQITVDRVSGPAG